MGATLRRRGAKWQVQVAGAAFRIDFEEIRPPLVTNHSRAPLGRSPFLQLPLRRTGAKVQPFIRPSSALRVPVA